MSYLSNAFLTSTIFYLVVRTVTHKAIEKKGMNINVSKKTVMTIKMDEIQEVKKLTGEQGCL